MNTCTELDHLMHFRPLVDCPCSCKYITDNVDKIGNKNDICSTGPSREKYSKYNQRDVNGKSVKADVSQRTAQGWARTG